MPQPDVSFYFDVGCPWTWNTSRWLVEVAGTRDFPITWRTFSLAIVNEGQEIPEQYRTIMSATRGTLRLMEALRADGRNDDIGDLYTELGRRWHHDHAAWSSVVVDEALATTGLTGYADAIDDETWDEALRSSLDEALTLAGPDVGSPVVRVGDRAMFGPIVSPPPTGEAALTLWDAAETMIGGTGVFELKRGRREGPTTGSRP
jgi:2-hydroxychromene-2-carboxylate isomerase